jgi:SpoVK/Ycf46/Vps4 family AAA+-type ATPase
MLAEGDSNVEPSPSSPTDTAEDLDTSQQAPIRERFEHLQCLVDFIEYDLSDALQIRTEIADGTIQRIAFVDLWHLFKPGDTILSNKKDDEQALRVYCVTGGRYRFPDKVQRTDRRVPTWRSERRLEIERAYDRRKNLGLKGWSSDESESSDDKKTLGSYSPLCLDCLSTMYDGNTLKARRYKHRIDYYTGQRHITDLSVYPIQFHDSSIGILDRLMRRGERFVSCSGHKLYSGPALKSLDTIHGEVYVDFKTGYAENRLLGAAQRRFFKLGRQSPDTSEITEYVLRLKAKSRFEEPLTGKRHTTVPIYNDLVIDSERADEFINSNRDLLQETDPCNLEPGDERFCLLPRAVVAFSFRSRKWHVLDIDLIKDIDKSDRTRDRGFDDLVISETYKQLLVALVENHRSEIKGGPEGVERSQPLPQMDIVRNKGQGICILLHGPPGVGKTSTAETIAAYTKRPLYSLTCGDMGFYTSGMENELEKHLALANKWGCVLLLDEADVFLMARDWQNTYRNASVGGKWFQLLSSLLLQPLTFSH